MPSVFMDGNEAVARGALAAGCRFFAGYPITPATTIFNHMRDLLPPAGGVCLQTEDEIAAIGACIGASVAGSRALTATSGPGISLFSEQIGFAVAAKIPLVIVDVQRLGPSTGSATKSADGDIQFLRWGCSGGMPVIVLAPVDAADCFHMTARAFELAEAYECPVFIASSKDIGMNREQIRLPETAFDPPDAAPPVSRTFMAPGKPLMRRTSSTYGPDHYITGDPDIIQSSLESLSDRLENAGDLPSVRHYAHPEARIAVLTYGASLRPVLAAREACAASGRPISVIAPRTLWPVPEEEIRRAAAKADHILVAEQNLGQYVREIRRILPNPSSKSLSFLGRMNGVGFTAAGVRSAVSDLPASAPEEEEDKEGEGA